MRVSDLRWSLPLAGLTAVTIASDQEIESRLPDGAGWIRRSNDAARYGVLAAGGLLAGTYLMGKLRGDDRLSETAWMAGEAAISSLLPALVVKTATSRARPLEARNTGFWQNGNSFPSDHSAAAWSIASVFAHEYPGLGTQILAYGAASAMSASRVLGRKHFASDVLIGSTLGWWFGRQVQRSHRQPQESVSQWGRFVKADGEASRNPASMGSPYVPLDSWVYPAFDRLAALGYAPSAFAGLRPWTRMECARLLEEMDSSYILEEASGPVTQTIGALRVEFAEELGIDGGARDVTFRVESVYARTMMISGQPLRDGYHFGQTIVNDFGRPYAEGSNFVSGVSSSLTAGPFAVYVRGEYQHAPSSSALPDEALNILTFSEYVARGPAPALPFREVNRFRLLDSYVTLNLAGWQTSFGKQSLWWGPGSIGPFLMSNNAEPVWMAKLGRREPFKLPWIFSWMGPVRTEFFVGKLAGHHFVNIETATSSGPYGDFLTALDRQPYISGQKISFKPTPNLEFGVARSGLFGGPEFPVTASTLKRVLFMFGGKVRFGRLDAGDRRSSFDFSYRIPGLRKWLILYNDSLADDEISPLGYPRRSAMNPGLYMPQIPRLSQMDFRFESAYTDLPGLVPRGFFYWNVRYLDGYTNNDNILGSWVGRQGIALQAQSTYHFSAKDSLQVEYRKLVVSPEFVEGDQENWSVRGRFQLPRNLEISTLFQYERWQFPVLAPERKSNVALAFQFTYRPQRGH